MSVLGTFLVANMFLEFVMDGKEVISIAREYQKEFRELKRIKTAKDFHNLCG